MLTNLPLFKDSTAIKIKMNNNEKVKYTSLVSAIAAS